MTLSVTVPDPLFQKVTQLAARQNVSVERLIASALAQQIACWERVERMAARGNREGFLEAMSKVPDVDPDPEDRLQGRDVREHSGPSTRVRERELISPRGSAKGRLRSPP